MEKILIFGMGSIGSLFAAYLSKKFEVYGIGRSWHINEIKKRGKLILRKVFSGEVEEVELKNVYTSVNELDVREFEYVFLTTKAYDLENALREIVESGIEFDCLVLLQNGLGIGDLSLKFVKDKNIVRGLTYNGANIPKGGEVNHAGLGETILSGFRGEKSADFAKNLVDKLNSVGLPSRYVENILEEEFKKIVVNATINPLTAIIRAKNKYVAEIGELRDIVFDVVDEIREIAKRLGVELKISAEEVLEVAKKTGENKSSMLQDIERGKPTEIDFINGAIVKLAEEKGLEAKTNKILYKLIKALEKI